MIEYTTLSVEHVVIDVLIALRVAKRQARLDANETDRRRGIAVIAHYVISRLSYVFDCCAVKSTEKEFIITRSNNIQSNCNTEPIEIQCVCNEQ